VESAFIEPIDTAIALVPATPETLDRILAGQSEPGRRWARQHGFTAKAGTVMALPAADGDLDVVLVGYDPEQPLWMLAAAVTALEPRAYRLQNGDLTEETALMAAVGWGLGSYRFERYKKAKQALPQLVWPEGVSQARVQALVAAHGLTRDLINTPSADLMPEQLVEAAQALVVEFGATMQALGDADALRARYPCIHAVGSASAFGPRVIELNWGEVGRPHVVLVGKGVCFDSGGLNLKPGNSMRLMKKDMGGAAIALGLARLIMALALPIRLTLLVGAVENAVGSRAFRPGDVLRPRNGKTVEIDNTDAEGRLVLADLLVRAGECRPDLVIDFATLTGAARVAVGTEIGAFFSNDENLAALLAEPARRWDDPVWPLPLHLPYRHLLDSDVADLVNSSPGGFAGAITAALFLQEFVPEGVPWLHFDVMAWNTRARPGRPKGGEAMGLRAVLGLLETRYGRG